VRTATRVLAIEHDLVRLSDGVLRSHTILWGAGVRASPLATRLGAVDRGGRVLVEPDLTLPGHPEVHVIGDMAATAGDPLPGIAPVAIQQGHYVGRAIRQAALGRPAPRPFRYRDKGAMATIGRKAAVAVVGRLRLRGVVAWVAWLLIHIMYLVGFKNRLAVLMGWWYSYVTWRRGARLITGDRMKAGPPEERTGWDGE
jgi:NADH dehydrogenase